MAHDPVVADPGKVDEPGLMRVVDDEPIVADREEAQPLPLHQCAVRRRRATGDDRDALLL